MKIGTIEPKYIDGDKHFQKIDGNHNAQIMDDACAFIYGAIAKYAWRPTFLEDKEYRESLKEYIIKEAEHIGEELWEYDKGTEPSEDD